MKNCPSCIPHLTKMVDSLGYSGERISKPEEIQKSFQTAATAMKRSRSGDIKHELAEGSPESVGVQGKGFDSLSVFALEASAHWFRLNLPFGFCMFY